MVQSSSSSLFSIPSRLLIPFVVTLALFEVYRNFTSMIEISTFRGYGEDGSGDLPTRIISSLGSGGGLGGNTTSTTTMRKKKEIIVAYAVSITHFTMAKEDEGEFKMLDRAAVLHKSIKLAMEKSITYDYHLYAFVHPDAIECIPIMTSFGYRVQVRDTPFNISDIKNPELIEAQGNGCCDEKEYLKLYSYLLSDYPVVVHLDLDTIVLRPMDDLFDIMTTKTTAKTKTKTSLKEDDIERFAQTSTMWMKQNNNNTGINNKTIQWSSSSSSSSLSLSTKNKILTKPEQINFMFTRDYNMVDPPRKEVYQIGVQGGFLVIRPNQRDFDRMVNIILSGGHGFDGGEGWGGRELAYGGYYGAGTIQGLASFYYDYYENSTRSVELNKCYYNTMVDNRYHFDKDLKKNVCRTTEDTCENCRETNLEKIYTAHFTVCGKPEWCHTWDPKKSEEGRLCGALFREWHKVRLSLEIDWMKRFDGYVPKLNGVNPTESREKYLESNLMGHCKDGNYIPLRYPNSDGRRYAVDLIT